MSLSTTPAPARTDLPGVDRTTTPPPSTPSSRMVRRGGAAVAVGSAVWAGGILAFGLTPVDGWQGITYDLSSLAFQLGLVALVTVQLRTGAIGTGRLARGLLHAEHVLLVLAIASTVTWMVTSETQRETTWFLLLDSCWPLSMIGMFAIGIRIAIAGRWRGAARFWPLGAESWAPVVIPVSAVLPDAAGPVAAAHLFLGYAALGVVLARRPELTGARD
ncbi:hypothetical protein [Modestobacter sp. SYSU DS0657]